MARDQHPPGWIWPADMQAGEPCLWRLHQQHHMSIEHGKAVSAHEAAQAMCGCQRRRRRLAMRVVMS